MSKLFIPLIQYQKSYSSILKAPNSPAPKPQTQPPPHSPPVPPDPSNPKTSPQVPVTKTESAHSPHRPHTGSPVPRRNSLRPIAPCRLVARSQRHIHRKRNESSLAPRCRHRCYVSQNRASWYG